MNAPTCPNCGGPLTVAFNEVSTSHLYLPSMESNV